MRLAFGEVLYEPADEVRYVYFPGDSLVSLLSFDQPLPQNFAQDDKVPVEVDGACCFAGSPDAVFGPHRGHEP